MLEYSLSNRGRQKYTGKEDDEMATTALKKVSVNVKLNNGTDASGNDKFVNVTLGNLSEENYDADKALAIVTALAPCLSKTVSTVEEVKVSTLTAA
ncbi:MAG: hypothetical protein IJR98_05065 [Synergistaceae bacterium]|nr:hypothetical protein [Synergistaceae bacterium]